MAMFEIKLISADFLLSLFCAHYIFHVIKMAESRHLFTSKWFICSCFSGNRDGNFFFFFCFFAVPYPTHSSTVAISAATAASIVLNLEWILIMTWVKPTSLSFHVYIHTQREHTDSTLCLHRTKKLAPFLSFCFYNGSQNVWHNKHTHREKRRQSKRKRSKQNAKRKYQGHQHKSIKS